MSKRYLISVIVVCALAIWGIEKVLSQTTTILGPDGSIIICQVTPNGVVICG
jgi:hypothetical protein